MKRYCLTCKKKLPYGFKYYCSDCTKVWWDKIKKQEENIKNENT